MRTVRCWGGGCLPKGCVSAWRICVCLGDVCLGGLSAGGVCQGGVCLVGVYLPPCEQNHRQVRCKNITFPQLYSVDVFVLYIFGRKKMEKYCENGQNDDLMATMLYQLKDISEINWQFI